MVAEKVTLSVVFLAKTDSQASYTMTMLAIESLVVSEPETQMEVIVVESNKNYHQSGFVYPDFVQLIIPESDFNFHQFLNVGIVASKGDFIALCNNDLIFHQDWFTQISKVAQKHSKILSFSPSGQPAGPNQKGTFEIGYRVMNQVMGWCIVARRQVFEITGLLDETFDFYYADNDYAMTLKYHNIRHAVVYDSYVEHLEKKPVSQRVVDPDRSFLSKYELPKYLKNPHYRSILETEKGLSGFLKYHQKWGPPKFLYRKNRMADILVRNNLGFLVRYFIKIKF